MNNHVLHTFGLNLMVAELLYKDLSAEQMTQQPHGLINHPAWNLGHLASATHEVCKLVGIESSLPDGWTESFGAGKPPDPDASKNPSKEELLTEFRACHERVSQAFPKIDPDTMVETHPDEGTRKYFPTIGDHLIYMMTAHEMDHLGQVAAWRRAMGLKPAM
jgi:uncharacterized damage-inducible protein DinB